LVELDPVAVDLLTGPRRPIVLLPRRASTPGSPAATATVSAEVAPGLADLGVMLPYTPLHQLLFGLTGDRPGPDVLVMTSGNRSGEPIITDDEQARERLAALVDGWLMHNRKIQVPADDSVVRIVEGEPLPIRRSRGYAPLPMALPFPVPATLAVGADLKNTFALASGGYAWLSQHLGEMDDVATLEAFGAAERHLEMLTGVRPVQLVADRHPGYRSAAWARRHANGRPVLTVQHHHAHVAALMAEHGLDGVRPVIGIAFDGTGYGDDGAVWGGELLLADYKGFRRLAHLRYVPLPGADAAIERPYRMALAHLASAGLPWDPALPPVAACPAAELTVLRHQLSTGFGCVPTSSMGRLFDAVAALLGVRQVVEYEAQAAIELETRARSATGPEVAGYRFAVDPAGDGTLIADPGPVLRSIVADLAADRPIELIGARFHAAVIALIVQLAVAVRAQGAGSTVALTGGVFQNARLLAGARQALRAEGFVPLCHRQVPPNDGGLALGQIVVAAAG
jgi:hydrogenase maturation protein HypF